MNIVLPTPPPNTPTTPYLTRLVQSINKAFTTVVPHDQAVARIILLGPNGHAYDVTVDNTGSLVVTLNSGN